MQVLKKIRKPAQREADLERACKRRVDALGGVLLKMQSGGGWPDRLLMLPGSRVAFIEFKRKGKKARALQAYRLATLLVLGFNARVVDSDKAFVALLREMGE